MHTLRRHSLCRRLLQQLLQYGRQRCAQPELNISMLGEGLTRDRELRLLQPYRLVSVFAVRICTMLLLVCLPSHGYICMFGGAAAAAALRPGERVGHQGLRFAVHTAA
jgi:hypothetical protein